MARTDITRLPEKTSRDRAVLDDLLDHARICHVGLVVDDSPLVIPTAVARDGDRVVVHGSTGAGWMRLLADGRPACVTVTALDGLVIARSAFESSMHYRSAVLFGSFARVEPSDRERVLDLLTEALLPGRVTEVRRPSGKELSATLVLAMPIEEWSLKVSAGWPEDLDDDIAGPAWAGVVPLLEVTARPIPAPDLAPDIDVPPSLKVQTGR